MLSIRLAVALLGAIIPALALAQGVAPTVTIRATPGAPTDMSVNKPDISGLNLLQTLSPGARNCWAVQNQSINTITVALDDGAGANLTIIILGPADTAGGQGVATNCTQWGPHQGRIRALGPAGSQVAIRPW